MDWSFATAARTLWMECRGEPLEGQQAVAWVLRNRLHTGKWGASLASVCLWRGQFSGWYVPSDPNFEKACALSDDDPVLLKMADILEGAMRADPMDDFTHNATYYFAETISQPSWAKDMVFCGRFGRQLFYRG